MAMTVLSKIMLPLALATTITTQARNHTASVPPAPLPTAVAASGAATASPQLPMMLNYDRPADFFEESLPIGNGRLGALVYGGTDDNIIYLNDITFWTGSPVDRTLDADAHKWIPKIREALFREDYRTADSLQLHIQGHNSQFFQPLATLHIKDLALGQVSGYHRCLNLDSAVVSDRYDRSGSPVTREYFASNADGLIAIRLRGQVNVRLALTAQVPHLVKSAAGSTTTQNGGSTTVRRTGGNSGGLITMTGHATGDPQQTIHFCTLLSVATDGLVTAADSSLTVSGATEAVVYVVNATSFNGFDHHPVTQGAPYQEQAADALSHAARYGYDELRQRHISDYRQLYSRLTLRLGNDNNGIAAQTAAVSTLSTDQLLRQYSDGAADSLAARYLETLYFQYGRYLLISSSRTPGVPANLQGLWTPHLWSPWRGNYTMNINLEENYWPAFVANLAEMAEPLNSFVSALSQNGRFTARNYYGIDRGWCASHNSDIWAMTNPVGEKNEKPEWANWNMGGAWLVLTLWERYLFTQDRQYLEEVALPLMRGAADFCLDWLVESPFAKDSKTGLPELITAPSTSPENEYVTTEGYHGMTCYGGTADLAIIRELFSATATACRLCGVKSRPYEQALQRLHPYTIGREGDLNEWYHDWRDYDPRHRHQSHLIGLYPGHHLLADPASPLLKACEQTLRQKGDYTTGWSTGWRINLWARLHRADMAYHIYQKLLTFVTPDNYRGPDRRHSGGTYPNLMDAHPPFQIDGNFGGTAGVCEMLVQSRDNVTAVGSHATAANKKAAAVGSRATAANNNAARAPYTIELLPALPPQWADGSVSGICARGGYELAFSWRSGKITSLTVKARKSGKLLLLCNGQPLLLKLKAGQTWRQDNFTQDGK